MSDKTAAKGDQPPAPSPWPLVLMVLLTLWMCQRPKDPKLELTACGTHLHKIGVELEKYRLGTEDGLYPATLDEAFKAGAVPVCTVGGKGTYAAGYKPSADRRSYLVVCKGEQHQKAGVPSDYPRIAFGPAETSPSGEESTVQGSPSPAPASQEVAPATPVAGQKQAQPASPSPVPVPVPVPATPNP